LVAVDEVGGAVEAECLELGGGEAGLLALVADDHDPGLVAGDLGDAMFARGIKAITTAPPAISASRPAASTRSSRVRASSSSIDR
jgi:hypothetical protein